MRPRLLIGLLVASMVAPAFAQRVDTPHKTARPVVPETLRILNQTIPDFSVDSVPFETVIQTIQELTQVNIWVRWNQLKGVGIERETPITIKARNARLSLLLWMVMRASSDGEVVLAYRLSGNQMTISTAEDLEKEIITRVYDVSDLMVRVENADRPQFNQSQGLGQNSGGGGSSIFQNNQTQNSTSQQRQAGQRLPEMDALIKVIQATIEPQSWADGPGAKGPDTAPGHIEAYGNLLVVTNTILVHQKLAGYVSE